MRTIRIVRKHHDRTTRVVACVDLSPTSHAVLRESSRHAAIAGGSVTVVHAFETPWELLRFGRPAAEVAATERRLRETLLQQLQRGVEALGEGGVSARVEYALVSHVVPAQGILEYVRQHPADLIVMGASKRGRLSRTLRLPLAESVLRAARCPVLSVPEYSADSGFHGVGHAIGRCTGHVGAT